MSENDHAEDSFSENTEMRNTVQNKGREEQEMSVDCQFLNTLEVIRDHENKKKSFVDWPYNKENYTFCRKPEEDLRPAQ